MVEYTQRLRKFAPRERIMMYQLYGIPTQNTFKVAYVMGAIEAPYEFHHINVFDGEHKKPEFLKINPIGKVPALKHDEFALFESGAICRYVANVASSPLYPQDAQGRAKVDAWMDFFSTHVGRWLSTLYFEKIMKKVYPAIGETNSIKCEEAIRFLTQQLHPLEVHLGESTFLAGETPTIADYAAFAYMEQVGPLTFDLSSYPNIEKWLQKMSDDKSVLKTKEKFKF